MTLIELKRIVDKTVESEGSNAKYIKVTYGVPTHSVSGPTFGAGGPEIVVAEMVRHNGTSFILR